MTATTPTPTEMATIAEARFAAIVRAPYLASALAAVSFVRQPELGTVAVDDRLRVYFDPLVLERWSTAELAGALLHEVNHVVRYHHTRQTTSGANPDLWNLAADLEINDDLTRADIELPAGALLPALFGLPDNELAEWYAEHLCDEMAPRESPSCGSGAGGYTRDFELGDNDDLPGLSPVQLDRIRDAIARSIVAHGLGAPGGLERWAQARLRSNIPWSMVLRDAIRRALPRGAGHHRHSWSRLRRHNPTAAILPSLRAAPIHIAVVVDSSGSMNQHDLDQAVSDVATLKGIPGVDRVTLISCDTEAVEVAVPRAGYSVALVGGGGTSLGAGLNLAPTLRQPADLVVVITDGRTDWPHRRPLRLAPVVALIPEGGPPGPCWMTTVTRPLSTSTTDRKQNW